MPKLLTWFQFNGQRMSKYMKIYKSKGKMAHAFAIRKIAKEWQQYKRKHNLK